MNTPSLRKTRAAVGDIITVVDNHGKNLDALGKYVNALSQRANETREIVDSLVDRGFFGRLKWIVTGH